ncbi:hypothetical protein Pint_17691 [Pistacia integerrima]|uniref:Uncharacterized protein n=1 Tax=Pistacia integerrima TaxID=434235 RepID=A0ACC0YX27_9ROSI|nr:hypothetical protein Pint_17691 [Pistacia integerrima]
MCCVQMVTLIIHRARGWEFIDALKWLKYTIIVQYLLKLVRICKSYVEAERAPGIPVEVIKWLNAASCFLIYLLPGHVFGGLWFFMAIERETDCWNEACLYYRRRSCGALHCDYHSSAGDNKFLGPYCPKIIRDTTIYDFGIFQDALQSGIVEETKFTTKLFYCLRWGLLTTSCVHVMSNAQVALGYFSDTKYINRDRSLYLHI